MTNTGYFAVAKGPRPGRFTKVHVVEEDKPICGAKIGSDMVFQWCAGGARWDYVECDHCKRIVRKRGLK